MPLELAQTARDLTELFEEPALTVACVLLIVTSIGWIVMSRLIVRQIRRAAVRAQAVPLDVVTPPRDIWSYPPPAHPAGSEVRDDDLVVVVDHMYIYDFTGPAGGGSAGWHAERESPAGGPTGSDLSDAEFRPEAEATSVIRLDERENAR